VILAASPWSNGLRERVFGRQQKDAAGCVNSNLPGQAQMQAIGGRVLSRVGGRGR
jgi:hypothetical protein